MSEWVHFIRPPREDFAAAMTDEQRAVWGVHLERFEGMLADGALSLGGPTPRSIDAGLAIFEARPTTSLRETDHEGETGHRRWNARGEFRPASR